MAHFVLYRFPLKGIPVHGNNAPRHGFRLAFEDDKGTRVFLPLSSDLEVSVRHDVIPFHDGVRNYTAPGPREVDISAAWKIEHGDFEFVECDEDPDK